MKALRCYSENLLLSFGILNKTTLLTTGEEERGRLKLRSARINSTSSYRQSKTTQLNLREFIESRGLKDIAFDDLTEEFGNAYKLYLKGKGYSVSHTNHNLCWLQRLIYIAVDRGLHPHHIGTTADGRKYIRERRAKTNNEAFIPLHPIAEQIMSLYNMTDNSKPSIFPPS